MLRMMTSWIAQLHSDDVHLYVVHDKRIRGRARFCDEPKLHRPFSRSIALYWSLQLLWMKRRSSCRRWIWSKRIRSYFFIGANKSYATWFFRPFESVVYSRHSIVRVKEVAKAETLGGISLKCDNDNGLLRKQGYWEWISVYVHSHALILLCDCSAIVNEAFDLLRITAKHSNVWITRRQSIWMLCIVIHAGYSHFLSAAAQRVLPASYTRGSHAPSSSLIPYNVKTSGQGIYLQKLVIQGVIAKLLYSSDASDQIDLCM